MPNYENANDLHKSEAECDDGNNQDQCDKCVFYSVFALVSCISRPTRESFKLSKLLYNSNYPYENSIWNNQAGTTYCFIAGIHQRVSGLEQPHSNS